MLAPDNPIDAKPGDIPQCVAIPIAPSSPHCDVCPPSSLSLAPPSITLTAPAPSLSPETSCTNLPIVAPRTVSQTWWPDAPATFKSLLPCSHAGPVRSSHAWEEDVSLPKLPSFEPHELHVTRKPHSELLRTTARIFHTHATTQPVLTLYDPGFSGEVMISSKLAHSFHLPMEPVNQDIILADGAVVKCEGIVRNVKFAPVDGFVEICDVLVFPLATYHVIVGMGWLREHHARILCRPGAIEFFPATSTPHECIDDVGMFTIHCSSAPHQDPACLSLSCKSALNVVTCNQFKSFLRADPDIETCAVFVHHNTSDHLPMYTLEPNLSHAASLSHLDVTLNALRTRTDIPAPARESFCSMLSTFGDSVFEDRAYSNVVDALARDVEHEINEIPHQPHPCGPIYRLSPPMLDELRTQIAALLDAGLIRPSMSPYGAPVLFARKKDGTWRLCIDYRALNKITVRDKFPLPRAEDLFDQVHGAKFFTKIDLRWGYHQIKIRPSDVPKTAFRTPFGSFEWLCMPFGLTNAPATFQRFVQNVLHKFLGVFACVYIDDILIYSRTADEHVEHVRAVLDALKSHKLLAKPTKCEWFMSSVEYLGHVVSGSGISVDPEKVRTIAQWPAPQTKTDVRSFLGLANYYRAFIHDFAEIAAPLHTLVHDKLPEHIPWHAEHQRAFDALKHALTHAPVLRTYDRDLKCTVVVTDASSSRAAIGAVLMQDDGAGPRPVAYFSRKMTSPEQRYTTREQELLAIKEALKHWKHYLLGISFTIHSDHQSLQYIFSQRDLSGKLLRWCDFLQQFDFDNIRYLPGSQNPVGDALSRPPAPVSPSPTVEGPAGTRASLEVMLCESERADVFYNVSLSSPVSTLHDLIRNALPTDKTFSRVWTALTSPHYNATTSPYRDRYSVRDKLLYFHDTTSIRVCVPRAVQAVLLKEFHDTPFSGHMGIARTHNAMAKDYYWPGMHKSIVRYINSCTTCQQNKATHDVPAGLARPLPVPDRPYAVWGLDFIMMPPNRDGKNCVVVFICHKSKLVHAVAATATGDKDNPLSAAAVARIYFDVIFRRYGLCTALVSDRDSRFVSSFWRALHEICGTSLYMSTAFHPQSDGLTERANRTVLTTLRCVLCDLGGDWADHLHMVEFAINNAVNASTGVSPFYACLGFHPRTPVSVDTHAADVPAAAEYVEHMQSIWKRSEDSMLRAQIAQVEHMDKHRRISPFKAGDLVYLSTRNISFDTPSKFTPKYVGPFKILEVLARGNAARLDLPATFKARRLHDVFNVSLLKPYVTRPDSMGPQRVHNPPPLAETSEGPLWAVDRVMQVAIRNGQRKVLVRWTGYGPENDTWEPYARFKQDCPDALAEWEALQPPRPKRTRKSRT